MGKVIPFPERSSQTKPKNNDEVVNEVTGVTALREMFTDAEVDAIKDELDFLGELDDLGLDTPEEES